MKHPTMKAATRQQVTRTWDRAGGDARAPDAHVRGGEVVEQARRVVVVLGRDRDVDDAARAVECLLERRVARVELDHLASVTTRHNYRKEELHKSG